MYVAKLYETLVIDKNLLYYIIYIFWLDSWKASKKKLGTQIVTTFKTNL